MGKLISFILILVIIDILFLATGQLTLSSPSSLIITAIQDPTVLNATNFWTILITGIGALVVVSAIIAGIATRNSDITIFAAMAGSLALLIGDYLVIYNHLASINQPLAIIIMAPIMITFTLTIVEWLRGKD